MAKTFTGLTSGLDTSGGGPYATASISPTTGATVYVGVVVGGMGGQAATSVALSGLSGTWTRLQHLDPSGGSLDDYPLWVFACSNWTGSGAVTITPTGGSPFGAWWSVVEVTASGAISVVGTPATNTATSATSLSITMAGFSDAANQALVFFAQNATSTGTNAGTGMSEIHDQSAFFGGGRLQSAYGTANDNAVDANTGGDTGDWSGIALEVNESSGGGGGGDYSVAWLRA